MYPRIINYSEKRSFFLFGPRGTGKSSWLRENFKTSRYLDLLDDGLYRKLLARPETLRNYCGTKEEWTVIDEVQRIPDLLNEVHRLIEKEKFKFILSGSSARKLKRSGTNLLAGRASTRFMYPFTSIELGSDFDFDKALQFGMLPEVWDVGDAKDYLDSYITTYLKEEVQQEGLTRNLGSFSRFLEIAALSQATPLNVNALAQEIGIDNKTAENYFTILEDLLLAVRLPVFSKHAKRELYKRAKFFYFDTGLYQAIRPKGFLDSPEFIAGAAIETLFFQEIRAINDYYELDYTLYYWRTHSKLEIDFILYGQRGLIAIELKRSKDIRNSDLKALQTFINDYPKARAYLFYGGEQPQQVNGIEVLPLKTAFVNLKKLLS